MVNLKRSIMNNEYLQFIEECRHKDYTNLVTQIHHIIPKHMGGDNSNDNLIELSLDDHYTAHLLLSDCYDGKYKQENIASAIYIKGYLDNLDKLEEYQKTLKGEGNPNYGNSWTVEKRKAHSEKIKQMWANPNNLKKIMKPKSDTSKMGKYDKSGKNNPFYGKTHSDEVKEKLSKVLVDKIEPISVEIKKLLADQEYLDQIVLEGVEKANSIASKKIERIKEIVGF